MTWYEEAEAEAAAYKEIKNLVDLTSWRYLMHLSDRKPASCLNPSMMLWSVPTMERKTR